MSNQNQNQPLRSPVTLTQISVLLALIGSIYSAVETVAILPYRLDRAEYELKKMKAERDSDREILIRVDESLKNLNMRMDQLLRQRRNEYEGSNDVSIPFRY